MESKDDNGTKWELVGFVRAGKLRQKIVCHLMDRKLTPSEISRRTGKKPGSVSKSLAGLREKNIIKCLNPNAKKGKIFSLTEEGEKVAGEICPQNESED
ncbi:MAG: winged helix-turn-helix domain-containing protein [Candidatus Odinarchaeota archaeon]